MSTNNTANTNTTNSTTTEATIMNKKVFNKDRVFTEASKKDVSNDTWLASTLNLLRGKETNEWNIYIPFSGHYIEVCWTATKSDSDVCKECTISIYKDDTTVLELIKEDTVGIFMWIVTSIKKFFAWLWNVTFGKAIAWWNKEEQENKEENKKTTTPEELQEELANAMRQDMENPTTEKPVESAPAEATTPTTNPTETTTPETNDECPLDRLFDIINGLPSKVVGTKQGKKIARTCKLDGSVKQRITSSYKNLGSFTTSLTSLLKKAGLSVEDIKAINADIKAAY